MKILKLIQLLLPDIKKLESMEKKDVYLLKVKKEVALQVFLLVVLAHLKTMETVIKILQRFHQWVLYQFVEHTKSLTTTV